MRRRTFIKAIGGAAVWPLAASAQQGERIRRVGVLMGFTETDKEGEACVVAFREALGKSGWIEGRNLRVDIRYAGADVERGAIFAKELVAFKPNAILGHNTPHVAALLKETRTIPIVFVAVSDPVGSKIVASFPHPGGNVTGFTHIETTLGGKWLQILKEIAPNITKATLIYNPDSAPFMSSILRSVQEAGSALSVKTSPTPIRDTKDIENVIASVGTSADSSLIVVPDSFTTAHRSRIIALTSQNRVPAFFPFRYFALEGGLVSYGVDIVDLFKRAAHYVDRILKGAQASDLPVQAPTKFELAINLKTAKALGLTVPPLMLTRADEVIE